MAKKDTDLFDRLRQAGLRKRAATALSEVSEGAGKKAERTARAAVKDLRALADEIELRLPAATPAPDGDRAERPPAPRTRRGTPHTRRSTPRSPRSTPRGTRPSAAGTSSTAAATAKPRSSSRGASGGTRRASATTRGASAAAKPTPRSSTRGTSATTRSRARSN